MQLALRKSGESAFLSISVIPLPPNSELPQFALNVLMATNYLLLFVMVTVAGCTPANPYSGISDRDLHGRASTLPLPQRYDLYVKVLRSEQPRRLVLATDIAKLGNSAWDYTFGRAVGGNVQEMSDALPALWAFNRQCLKLELNRLRRHVKQIGAEALSDRIETLCGGGLPAGD